MRTGERLLIYTDTDTGKGGPMDLSLLMSFLRFGVGIKAERMNREMVYCASVLGFLGGMKGMDCFAPLALTWVER